ncbi:MAG TPA: alpha/beta hydrolase [Gemmataceae bacterium]|nr:alpha/beta hydrolase [Gemmataceae bacterium]
MRFALLSSTLAFFICLTAGRAAEQPLVLDLWPGKVPGETTASGEEKLTGEKGRRQLTNVSKPTLTVYRPDKDKNTGVAVIIAPGGGYRFLAWDHEGEDVAAWLNSLGVTGVLLKYRVPRRPDHPAGPLQDAQRALSLVRSKAKEWGMDPKRIGMLGFSAGGHLTALTATNFDKRAYDPSDDADQVSCRPDFAVIIYPGGVVDRSREKLDPAIRVSKETPPTFLAQSNDDQVGPQNSAVLYLALKKAQVPAELHIFATGGHGYGMRPSKNPCSEWPKRCEEWLRVEKILQPSAAVSKTK